MKDVSLTRHEVLAAYSSIVIAQNGAAADVYFGYTLAIDRRQLKGQYEGIVGAQAQQERAYREQAAKHAIVEDGAPKMVTTEKGDGYAIDPAKRDALRAIVDGMNEQFEKFMNETVKVELELVHWQSVPSELKPGVIDGLFPLLTGTPPSAPSVEAPTKKARRATA